MANADPSLILQVAVNGRIAKPLDYKPFAQDPPPPIGARLWVPLGKKEVVGVVIGHSAQSAVSDTALRTATRPIDPFPLWSPDLLQLAAFASRYYHYPIGPILLQHLPAALRKGQPFIPPPVPAPDQAPIASTARSVILHPDQVAACNQITAQSGFHPYLLFGVTGSGKTEVYLEAATLHDPPAQILVLVPEIGLTPQLLERFQSRFPDRLVLAYHSGLTPAQKLQVWQRAWTGEAAIVIGTRSAVFMPMPQLRLILVDEEHDPSFKQTDTLRYSGRDLAIYRAQQAQIPIVLGSATPSLESYAHAQSGKYTLLSLPHRAGASTLPSICVLDIRKKPLVGGMAPETLAAIGETLARQEQVLVFINRRGYAPLTVCHTCGTRLECPACDAYLTWHAQAAWLVCHHCNRKIHQGLCPCCGADDLIPMGYGTERLEDLLKTQFAVPVLRFDRDNMGSKKKLLEALQAIHNREVSIIVGTQMLAKGHHFPDVTLGVIMDVDQGLYSSDVRSRERLAQMITQVMGRTGRGIRPGHVILQTHTPQHPMLQLVLEKGYAAFAEHSLLERYTAGLPPYHYTALVAADAKDEKTPMAYLTQIQQEIAHFLQNHEPAAGVTCIGPAPPRMAKLAHYHRAQLLLTSAHRAPLHRVLDHLQARMPQIRLGKKVRTAIDVDPESF